MGELVDRVNAILNGEKVENVKPVEQRPWWWKEPLAFGELPEDIGIPMDKSHRIPIIEKKSDGVVLLCGKPYSEKNQTEKGWKFKDAVDVMSWAYYSGFKFRPEVWGLAQRRGSADTEDVSRVEVYIRKSIEMEEVVSVKKGTGLKFGFDTDGSLSRMSYSKDGNYQHVWGITFAEIWKGTISADNKYGETLKFDFDGDTIGFW